ncbi:B3/4 domain-containing protein [Fictibacillus iocasae]|uniref:B3/4 domain-containing protein n=1 Tax=Fictibacillus iocasae TaxID=2715437 RepID=A0ABW2NR82_9BACL
MKKGTISPAVKQLVPGFKIGFITYHHIAVGDSPQMIKGRFQLFTESIRLEDKQPSDWPYIKEYRDVFKSLGTDPSRYRPASEALLRRVLTGKDLSPVNSAVDVNNFFSLRHALPLGIYDAKMIDGDVEIRLGNAQDEYEGLNGRLMNMEGKLVSCDAKGAFGSPIVDSKRTMMTEQAKEALHIIYLPPSLEPENAEQLLTSIAQMFTQVHGGEAHIALLT